MYDSKSSNAKLGGWLGAAGSLIPLITPLSGFFSGGSTVANAGGMKGGQVGYFGGSFGNAGASDMRLKNTMLGTSYA